jgi:hypothetical protein
MKINKNEAQHSVFIMRVSEQIESLEFASKVSNGR